MHGTAACSVRFAVEQWLAAAAPSNFLALNAEAQKKAMAQLQSGLAAADYFMTLPAAAQCKQISLKASSSMFEGKKSEHSDLNIDFAFDCAQPAALTEIPIALFAKHTRLKTLKVDMVGPKGQKSVTLTAKNPVLRF